MLTGDYMPEYGRVSGGQIRMVTKSGGNRFSGSGVVLLSRRQAAGEHVDAQHEPEPVENQRRGAVQLQAVRLLGRRPDPEGQAVLLRRAGVGQLPGRCRPTPRRCRPRRCGTGDFSELLVAEQRVLQPRRRSSRIR